MKKIFKIKDLIYVFKKFFMNWELHYNYNLYLEGRISYIEYRKREQRIRHVYNIRY